MIKKEQGKFCLYSDNGSRKLACFKTLKEAREAFAKIQRVRQKRKK